MQLTLALPKRVKYDAKVIFIKPETAYLPWQRLPVFTFGVLRVLSAVNERRGGGVTYANEAIWPPDLSKKADNLRVWPPELSDCLLFAHR